MAEVKVQPDVGKARLHSNCLRSVASRLYDRIQDKSEFLKYPWPNESSM
jgi:hypothetical protein